MMRIIQERWRSERGIALVMVMMAVLALMIVTVEFVYTTRVHYAMAQNLRDRLQAEYLAKSAIQIALLVLKLQKQMDEVQSRVGDKATLLSTGPLYQQIPIDTTLLRTSLVMKDDKTALGLSDEERRQVGNFLDFSGDFSAKIEDEQGKINLNALADVNPQGSQSSTASETTAPTPSPAPTPTPKAGATAPGTATVAQVTIDQLTALMEPLRYDDLFRRDFSRADLIYHIADWVDSDNERGGFHGGLEDGAYTAYDPPYGAKNAKFDSVEEVALVEGMSQEILDTFRASWTVYGTGNRVNINAANKTLLYGLIEKLIHSKNEKEVEQIVDWIDGNRNFKNQGEFLQGMSTFFGYESNDLDGTILSSLVFQSNVFSITATGSIGLESEDGQSPHAVSATIRAVVANNASNRQRTGQFSPPRPGGLQILYWRVE